jgi:hypothetical protein
LLTNDRTQALNVSRYDGHRHVTLEAHDPVIPAQVQPVAFECINA